MGGIYIIIRTIQNVHQGGCCERQSQTHAREGAYQVGK